MADCADQRVGSVNYKVLSVAQLLSERPGHLSFSCT